MTTTEERLRILKMIEDGVITAEEGARLLEALEEAGPKREPPHSEATPPRWFRVRVTDLRSGKAKANVNIPVGLVDVGLKIGARFRPDIEGLDFSTVAEALRRGVQGKICDIEDAQSSERVEIYVE
ncbi:MAG: hypothetical protein QHJ81_08445 [Anaerolineae bacterium]|nr:hypothetical protein [Anaerolineae bacterium]